MMKKTIILSENEITCFLFSLSFGTKTKKVTKEEFKKYVEEVLG